MKYMILIHSNPAAWRHPMHLHQHGELSAEERERRQREFKALLEEISGSGELVESEPLAAPATARTVRVHDGIAAVTDGPFAEAKEQLAGYFLVDVETAERGAEIAARFPDARDPGSAVEVRPVMELSGMEM